jgi:hypothetical protein
MAKRRSSQYSLGDERKLRRQIYLFIDERTDGGWNGMDDGCH